MYYKLKSAAFAVLYYKPKLTASVTLKCRLEKQEPIKQ